MLISSTNNGTTSLYALRRKRLSGWIDESLGTDLHVFYRKVKLAVNKSDKQNKDGKEYTIYFLKIKLKNKVGEWKLRASVYRQNIEDCVDENKTYKVALKYREIDC